MCVFMCVCNLYLQEIHSKKKTTKKKNYEGQLREWTSRVHKTILSPFAQYQTRSIHIMYELAVLTM